MKQIHNITTQDAKVVWAMYRQMLTVRKARTRNRDIQADKKEVLSTKRCSGMQLYRRCMR